MISYFQAIILGLLQGITELFPISSLGHSVIFPQLFGWHINQNSPLFLTFLVATHLATALVLLLFFWQEWWNILKGIGRSLRYRQIRPNDSYAKLGWLLILGTVPAGILGLVLQKKLQLLFASAQIAALFLIANGAILYFAEYLRKKAPVNPVSADSDSRLAKLSVWQAAKVGLCQVLALLPGLSRSGSTMAGSLIVGLSHEDAARFSFLLATPIIGAAAVLKLPEFLKPQNHAVIGPAAAGALCAALAAYVALKFLVRYFHTNTLKPFANYCIISGIIYSIILHWR